MSTKIYEAYHMDADEGRASIHLGFFDNRVAAGQCLDESRARFTNPVPVHGCREIIAWGTLREFKEDRRQRVITTLRHRLNEEEKAALGL